LGPGDNDDVGVERNSRIQLFDCEYRVLSAAGGFSMKYEKKEDGTQTAFHANLFHISFFLT
uniref:hypothetical protein n=1 Tax=Hungatella effluvii TaxID=1096246 RepID=UPI002A80014D